MIPFSILVSVPVTSLGIYPTIIPVRNLVKCPVISPSVCPAMSPVRNLVRCPVISPVCLPVWTQARNLVPRPVASPLCSQAAIQVINPRTNQLRASNLLQSPVTFPLDLPQLHPLPHLQGLLPLHQSHAAMVLEPSH